jgi:RNA polymerase sigma factor (sigma-70 family)
VTTHDVGRPRPDGPEDAVLATRAAAGDSAALAAIFDRYAPRILALCVSVLRRHADAEDCLQDVFVIAATRLSALREPDRLRAWLFAIARHECLARIGKNAREVPVDTVPDSPGADPDQPATRAVGAELAEVVHSAESGLSPRDRLALELADRQGLATDELGAALGMSASSAYKTLVRARATARRSLGALLVARTGRRHCTELGLLLADWDGRLTQLLRKRIVRHVEECRTCAERERRLVDPAALFGGMPAIAVPFRLRSHVLTAADRALRTGTPAGHAAGWRDGWPPSSAGIRFGGRTVGVGAAVVAALVVLAAVVVTRGSTSPPIAQRVATIATTTRSTTAPSVTPSVTGTGVPTTTRTHRTTSTAVVTPPTVESASVTCVLTAAGRTRTPRLTWVSTHDTGVEVFVGTPTGQAPYETLGPKGTVDLPSGACSPTAAAPTYTITTVGGTGPAATRTVTLDRTPDTTTTIPTTTTTSPSSTITIG